MIKPQTSARLGLSSALALAVVLAVSPGGPTFAGCTWTWDGDHDPPGWHVHCSFQDDIFIEGTEGPGGGGGCSNCVAMTSSECNAIKNEIIENCNLIGERLPDALSSISDAKNYISLVQSLSTEIRQEGDSFKYYSNIVQVPGGNLSNKVDTIISGPTGPYLDGVYSGISVGTVTALMQGNNGVYTYYNQSVVPFLNGVDQHLTDSWYYLEDAEDRLSGISAHVQDIRASANSMNCSACSSGSGGGSGTPGDGGCPCAAYIQAVQSAVVANGATLSNLLSSVNSSKDILTQILSKLTEIKTVLDNIKDDVYRIRQTTDLMDDFFKEDTEINFSKLIEHTLTLSNLVVKFPAIPQYILHSDYSNATHFVDNDKQNLNWSQVGQTISTPADGMPIDFGEYAKLNWFQRIEYLLGSLAQIFTPTNAAPPDDFSDADKAQITASQSGVSGVSYDEPKGIVQNLLSKVESSKSRLNPFQNFLYGVQKPSTVTVIPDISLDGWFQGFKLPSMVQTSGAITIDVGHSGDQGSGVSISTISDLAHNISTFIWLLMLFVINITFFVFFVRSLVRLNKWYWRMVNAWSPTLIQFK